MVIQRSVVATILVIAVAHVGIVCGPAKAASSNEELTARIEKLEEEKAALRKENQLLRAQQRRRNSQAVSGQGGAAQPAPALGAPGSYAAAPAGRSAYAAVPFAGPNWTGFYMGVNLGLSVGRGLTSRSSQFNNDLSVVSDTFKMSPFGAIGGVQIGYNWQAAPNWVLGVEADFQGSGERQSVCVDLCNIPAVAGFTRNITIDQKLDWFGTVRGRVGWTSGQTLFYATGGLAYGHVTTDVALSDFNFGTPVNQSAHSATTKTGWTAGFGAEMQIVGNWTGKIEYLYVDLGNVATANFTAVFTPQNSETHQISSSFQDHIFRLGLNYKFGGPVYASAAGDAYGMAVKGALPAVYNWSGLYVGANLGLGVARNDTTTTLNTINNTAGTVSGISVAEQFTMGPLGAIGGAQVGYNWQAAPHWVLGIEADFQGSGQRDSVCLNCGAIIGGGVSGSVGTTLTQRIDWFGTLRGRAGWTDGPVLYYATGGLAYGHISTDERVDTIPFLTGVSTSGSFAQTKVGWTVGAGAETRLSGNWSVKAEYLYMDLGSVSGNVIAPQTVIPLNVNPNNVNISENRGFNSSIHDHIFRLGANYKFD